MKLAKALLIFLLSSILVLNIVQAKFEDDDEDDDDDGIVEEEPDTIEPIPAEKVLTVFFQQMQFN